MSSRTILAAELTRRIPAMAQDCAVNNERVITALIDEYLGPGNQRCQESVYARSPYEAPIPAAGGFPSIRG